VKRGDRYIAYPFHPDGNDSPARQRLFVEVTRMARDGTWADIRVCNCFVMWTKRQQLTDGELPSCVRQDWDASDIDDQLARWDEVVA
jgi:hypothetical protein